MDKSARCLLVLIVVSCLIILYGAVKVGHVCIETHRIAALEATRDSVNYELDWRLKWQELNRRVRSGYIKPDVRDRVMAKYDTLINKMKFTVK